MGLMLMFKAFSVVVGLEQLCTRTLNKAVLIVTDLQQTACLTLCLLPPAAAHDFGTGQKTRRLPGSLTVVKAGRRLLSLT